MGWDMSANIEGLAVYNWDWSVASPVVIPRERFFPAHGVPAYHSEDALDAVEGDSRPLEGRVLNIFRTDASVIKAKNRVSRRVLARSFSGYLLCLTQTDNTGQLHYCIREGGTGREVSRRPTKDTQLIQLHNTAVLVNRYSWSVTLRTDQEHIGLRVPTDPTGIRAVLRDRETGSTRRTPLLHWVNEHLRQNRSDPDALDYVRAYLRGSRKCLWRGYQVEIRESEQERELMTSR